MTSRTVMVIVGGPNGSGKSTLTAEVRNAPAFEGFELHDPDAIARELRAKGIHRLLRRVPLLKRLGDLAAVRAIEARVAEAIVSRRSFIVETVMSTKKYLDHIVHAREAGFHIALYFVALPSADLNVARVGNREKLGGHGVAEAKVRKRWLGSHRVLAEVAPLVDELTVFDNSADDGVPRLIATKDRRYSAVQLHLRGVLPQVEKALSL